MSRLRELLLFALVLGGVVIVAYVIANHVNVH